LIQSRPLGLGRGDVIPVPGLKERGIGLDEGRVRIRE
jgi:hypothetical protein